MCCWPSRDVTAAVTAIRDHRDRRDHAGPPGASAPATELNISIDSVTVASPPVVEFTVTDQDGSAYPGLTDNDLRFNIAKLIPGASGRSQPVAELHCPCQRRGHAGLAGTAAHGISLGRTR